MLYKPGRCIFCIFLVNAASNENLLHFNIGAALGDDSFDNGPFFKEKNKLTNAYQKAIEVADAYEMKVLKHEKAGEPDPNHVAWFIHKETKCNLLMLHVNVGILKKKAIDYYQYIHEISKCFSDFK